MLQSFVLLVVLIFLNAIFASAELAVISMNAAKLKKMATDGNKSAKKLLALTEQPARFLATIQVAITLASLLQSAFAAENFAEPLVNALISLGVTIPAGILKSIAIVVITLVLAYFTLVFGELIPKRIAMQKSESLALALAGMLYAVAKVFSPIVWLLTASTNGILRLIGINPDSNNDQVTEEEIRMMLTEGNEQGTIHEEENEIIQNVFEFNDTDVQSICTHRPDIVMLYSRDTDEEWAETIKENRHTLYPICGENMDDIVGVLDSKDYFRLEDKSRENLMKNAVMQPFFVPEGMHANVLFRQMKENHNYFAVIIDEYGSLSGIITLHDLLEALVGDLNEEEEAEEIDIEQISENTWKILGKAYLEDVAELLNVEVPVDTYDTFSGFICDLIDRIPANGECFTCETDAMQIEVHSVENHVIGNTTVTLKFTDNTETEADS